LVKSEISEITGTRQTTLFENIMKTNYSAALTRTTNSISLSIALIIFTCITSNVSGQTTGDYRSNTASGNWNSISTWQRWNGSQWLTPTSAQGWPGQYAGTGEVSIQANQVVTINNITTQLMGKLSINGELDVIGKTNNLIQTPFISVNNKVPTPNANINFPSSQGYLRLPAGAVIDATPIDPSTQTEWLRGSCTNNNEIIIGTITFAVCTGKGNDSPLYSFDEVQANGGTLKLLQ